MEEMKSPTPTLEAPGAKEALDKEKEKAEKQAEAAQKVLQLTTVYTDGLKEIVEDVDGDKKKEPDHAPTAIAA